MTSIRNKTVLITGGSSGIGKIMGRLCLEKGASNLVIWDLNVPEDNGDPRIRCYRVDVSDYGLITRTYARVKEEVGQVDILINCAGIVRGNSTFDRQDVNDIRMTMEINATAPMMVALPILADMTERDSGHICNIASAAGMLGIPRLSVYCASKWAVIGWADSLRVELKLAKSKVKSTVIAPYFINTGMFDGVNSKFFPILDPEKTASKIIRAIEKDKVFKGLPFSWHFIRLTQGILPGAAIDWIFGKVFGIYSVMDRFTGRKAR